MTNRILNSDLLVPGQCGQCGRPIDVHLTPMGDPIYLIRTGWCQHCQSALFGVDGMLNDVSQAAVQLIEHLSPIASFSKNPGS